MARRSTRHIHKVDSVVDVSGRDLGKGDTVTTLAGDLTGRVCDMAVDGGAMFVLLRPVHQPYGPGIWHPADQVNRVAVARVRKKAASREATAPSKSSSTQPAPRRRSAATTVRKPAARHK